MNVIWQKQKTTPLHTHYQKATLHYGQIKDYELDFPNYLVGPNCNHKYLYKREDTWHMKEKVM